MNELFYLTTHSTHFIYGYMASGIWYRTTKIGRKETRCRHIGYSFRLAAKISHIMAFVTPVVEHWLEREIAQWDRSDDLTHHERTLLPRSYISLLVLMTYEWILYAHNLFSGKGTFYDDYFSVLVYTIFNKQ